MFKFIVIFLKILAVACILSAILWTIDIAFFSKEEKVDVKVYEEKEVIQVSNLENEEKPQEKAEEKSITESIKQVEENSNNKTQTTTSKNVSSNVKTENTKQNTNTSTNKVEQSSNTTSNIETKVEETKKEEVIPNNTNNNTNTNVTTNTPTTNNTQNNNTQVEEQPKVEEDKYVVNNNMINQMKRVIENNPSELMLEIGYNVVVDSSIITETNQFTFAEFRVKNKIINKFGTIKIYAQDYYYKGQYMYTECYLI